MALGKFLCECRKFPNPVAEKQNMAYILMGSDHTAHKRRIAVRIRKNEKQHNTLSAPFCLLCIY